MRQKKEILESVMTNINRAPPETRAMLYHERCQIELMIDIRDVLRSINTTLDIMESHYDSLKGGE